MFEFLKKVFRKIFPKIEGTGYVADKSDPRDFEFGELVGAYPSDGAWKEFLATLPDSFRLDYDMDWFYNQGSTSSCVFHSAIGILNFIYKKKFSPRYLSRYGFGISKLNWGAYMRDGVKALDKFGSILYDEMPNDSNNTNSDKIYRSIEPTVSHNAEALLRTKWLFVRVDSKYGSESDFDCARVFMQKENMPCVVGVRWYAGWNNYVDGAKIDYAIGTKFWGHAMLCIGWEGDYYVLVDSYDRIIKLHKRNATFDIWGILGNESIERYHIELRPERENRNIKLEKRNATLLSNVLERTFAPADKARSIASRFWFLLIDAITYEGYTDTDLMNWLTHYKRTSKELFDITKSRKITLE